MTTSRRHLLAAVFAGVLAGGCSTSPPGAGFTSGDKPTLTSDEKAGVRDDLQAPAPDSGDAKLAGSAANISDPGPPPASEPVKVEPAPTGPEPK